MIKNNLDRDFPQIRLLQDSEMSGQENTYVPGCVHDIISDLRHTSCRNEETHTIMLCMSYQNIEVIFPVYFESFFIHFTNLSVDHISHDCHQHAPAIFLDLLVEIHVHIDGPAHTLNC